MNMSIKKVFPAICVIAVTSVSGSMQGAYAADFPEKGDFSRGAQAWVENCNRCHNYRDPQELRDDQWITSMFHMRIRAGLTGQETRDLITYMQEANRK
jgi:cytochrome c1